MHAKVQGEGAPKSIVAALDASARWGQADVVIIGRGGGVARTSGRSTTSASRARRPGCPIPTISAVGHEVDITLCDLVADLRAATPSAAAEAAVPRLHEISSGT